jgi:hypothetical protein
MCLLLKELLSVTSRTEKEIYKFLCSKASRSYMISKKDEIKSLSDLRQLKASEQKIIVECFPAIVAIFREEIEAARHHSHNHSAIDTLGHLVGLLRLLFHESFTEEQLNLLKEELRETLQYLGRLLYKSDR